MQVCFFRECLWKCAFVCVFVENLTSVDAQELREDNEVLWYLGEYIRGILRAGGKVAVGVFAVPVSNCHQHSCEKTE